MSVTFSSWPPSPVLTVELLCWESTKDPLPSTDTTAFADAAKHTTTCSECAAYGGPIVQLNRVVSDVNLSNTNAAALLTVLGFEELSGSATAEDFLGRVLVAEAINPPDEGRPTVVEGNVTYCGTSAGYTEKRLTQLRELADWANQNSSEITWG